MSHRLEVPVFGSHSAHLAIEAGAHRLELNHEGSYPQGGTTPNIGNLQVLRLNSTPVRVMIRPRGPPNDGGADFIYSDRELEGMREQIRLFAESGMMKQERGDGFVFGVVRRAESGGEEAENGRRNDRVVVDVERCRELVQLAAPWPCIFHRAFDDILGSKGSTPEKALADLDRCQFYGLLTSGGPGSAANNTQTLAAVFLAAAQSDHLREVIIGGGVRSSNVAGLRETLLPVEGNVEVWFHSSCLTNATESEDVDVNEVRNILDGLAGSADLA